jgi:glycosyltransferase involved in cell wall biosynthesis
LEQEGKKLQGPDRKTSLTIVSMSDPLSPAAGGITPDVIAYLSNLETLSPALVGLRIGGTGRAGKWTSEKLGPRAFRFFPLLSFKSKDNWRRRVPIAPIFLLKLFAHRRAILQSCGSLHICRAELALPFVLGKRRCPVVVNIRGASKFLSAGLERSFYELPGARWLLLRLERYVLSRADAVVLVSDEAYRYYVEKMPSLKGRLFLIPPSVDTELFRPRGKADLRAKYCLPEKSRLLVYAGRFVPEKRVDTLIESVRTVRRSIPDAILVLIGNGPEMPRLERMAPRDGSVVFLGVLGREQMAEVLSACDVALLFSMFEGMSLFVLESLACGIPVVSTDVGDVSKVVLDGLTGFIVRVENAEALAETICKALRMETPVSENCRRIAARYASPAITCEVERLHMKLQEGYDRV